MAVKTLFCCLITRYLYTFSFRTTRNLSIKTDFVDFGHKFLNPDEHTRELRYHSTKDRAKVDETDLKILSAMLSYKTIALRQIERLTSIPFSTVRRRVSRMEQLGIIDGYKYQYDPYNFTENIFCIFVL